MERRKNGDINFKLEITLEWNRFRCYYFMFSLFMTDCVPRLSRAHTHTLYRVKRLRAHITVCKYCRPANVPLTRYYRILSHCVAMERGGPRVSCKINKTFCLSIFVPIKCELRSEQTTDFISFHWMHDSVGRILYDFVSPKCTRVRYCACACWPLSLMFEQNSKLKCRIY